MTRWVPPHPNPPPKCDATTLGGMINRSNQFGGVILCRRASGNEGVQTIEYNLHARWEVVFRSLDESEVPWSCQFGTYVRSRLSPAGGGQEMSGEDIYLLLYFKPWQTMWHFWTLIFNHGALSLPFCLIIMVRLEYLLLLGMPGQYLRLSSLHSIHSK